MTLYLYYYYTVYFYYLKSNDFLLELFIYLKVYFKRTFTYTVSVLSQCEQNSRCLFCLCNIVLVHMFGVFWGIDLEKQMCLWTVVTSVPSQSKHHLTAENTWSFQI